MAPELKATAIEINISALHGDYKVHVGSNIITELFKEAVLKRFNGKVILVTDSNVDRCWGHQLETMFASKPQATFKLVEDTEWNWVSCDDDNNENQGSNGKCTWYKCVVPPGETSKTMGCMTILLELMAHLELTRRDKLVAFGGGVIGDLSGYVASSYMRGIDYIQIPTTLLAMIDSSVGGKVAVNLKHGKNLAGAFYSPIKVLIEITYLTTLHAHEIASGMGEAVKYGMIDDPSILETLEHVQNGSLINQVAMEALIVKCVQSKSKIVSQDEFENGLRMILNYGHTFGHGIEAAYDYRKYTHGASVGLGMVVMEYFTQWYLDNGDGYEVKPNEHGPESKRMLRRQQLVKLLNQAGLPVDLVTLKSLPMDKMKAFVFLDKKSSQDDIQMIFIEDVGVAKIEKVPKNVVAYFMDHWVEILENYEEL